MSVPSLASNRVNVIGLEVGLLENQVLDLSQFVYTLSGAVQSLILNDLSDELFDLSDRTNTLSGAVDSLRATLTDISLEVDVILPDITGISGRLDGLSLEFDSKQNDFAGLSGDLYILESQVLSISGDLTSLDSQVGTLTSYTYDLGGQVSTLSGQFINLSGYSYGLGSQVSTLSGQFINLSGYSYSLGSQVSTISGKLIDLSNYVDSFSPTTPTLLQVLTAGASAGGLGINGLGDVGIGHTSPSYNLDVSGNTRISSKLGINTTPTTYAFDMNGTFNMTNGTRSGTHPTTLPWYATADIGAESSGFQFGHVNGTTGVGIGYSGLYMAGSTTNLPMNINSKGTGGIVIKPGGTTISTFTSTGLGIGTSTPGNQLHIVKSSNYPELAVQFTPGGQILIQGCGSAGAYMGYSGYLAFGSCSGTQLSGFTDLFRFTTAGRLGIGRTAPGYQLELSLDSAGKPSTGLWTITSDKRVKENIVDADLSRCYEIVKNLPLKHYKWKDEYYTHDQIRDRSKLGWIADEVESYFPKGINTISDWIYKDEIKDSSGNIIEEAKKLSNIKTLNSDQIYAVMYGTIQKLIQTTENLSKEIEILKTKLP